MNLISDWLIIAELLTAIALCNYLIKYLHMYELFLSIHILSAKIWYFGQG